MGKVERRAEALLEMLRADGKIGVDAARRKLGVSEVTIRRLFTKLESEGKIIRTHGGALPIDATTYSYLKEQSRARKEKLLLGTAAAKAVESGDRIFLDSGTTLTLMAEALAARLRSGSLSDILVLTHSLGLHDILGSHAKMILAGGEYRPDRRDVCGSAAERTLSDYHVDKAFFGADGYHPEHGMMCVDEHSRRIIQAVMARSKKKYALADSDKFARTSLVAYAQAKEFDKVFSDEGLPKEIRAQLRSAGVEVELVGQ